MKNIIEIVLTAIFFGCVIAIIIVNPDLQRLIAYPALLDFGILLGRIWKAKELN